MCEEKIADLYEKMISEAKRQGVNIEIEFIIHEANKGNDHCMINFCNQPYRVEHVMRFLTKYGFNVTFGMEKDVLVVSWKQNRYFKEVIKNDQR